MALILLMKKKANPTRLVKIIVIILIIPLAFYFWPLSLGGDSEILIVQGQSMLPTILPGSLVITKSVSSYQLDDIVSYNLVEDISGFGVGGDAVERIVIHRIIEETEDGFLIKGDNNRNIDPGTYTEDEIRGKVYAVIPYVGEAFELLRNPVVLFIAAISMFVIQSEQKKRKKWKEKLRRIRLGLTPNQFVDQEQKKPKKPEYTLFYAALAVNVITFVIIQISIVNELVPLRSMGDMLTGFLYRTVAASLASTLIFGLYFLYIFGVYFLLKVYGTREKKSKRRSKFRRGRAVLEMILGKNFDPIQSVANILWILLVLVLLFNLLAMSQGLIDSVTDICDPSQEIC